MANTVENVEAQVAIIEDEAKKGSCRLGGRQSQMGIKGDI